MIKMLPMIFRECGDRQWSSEDGQGYSRCPGAYSMAKGYIMMAVGLPDGVQVLTDDTVAGANAGCPNK